MQQAFKEYSNRHTLKPGSHFAGFSHSSECSGNFCLCYTHSFRRLSDAFPMFGRRGTLKSCSFEVPIGSDGMLPDAFPMSFRCLILRQEGVGKKNNWEGIHAKELGRDLKGIIWGRDRRGIGKVLGRHSRRASEGIGKALESNRESIGKHR